VVDEVIAPGDDMRLVDLGQLVDTGDFVKRDKFPDGE
jgi:hypothetical protein